MVEFNKRNARMWSIMGINPCIWSVGLEEVLTHNKNIAIFTADLQRYSGLNRLFTQYPELCFNMGIAEQNMVGSAAGMAMEGVQTWMTTYAPFMSFRCADHFRHLMGNLNLNMKAIGSAAGFAAGLSGSSLLAVSDMAFARSVPNMVVLSPADCAEAIKMVLAISEIKSPVYMRFCGTTNIPMVYTADYEFVLGKINVVSEGEKIAVLATGNDIVYNAIKAAKTICESKGFSPLVADVHTIKPFDKEFVKGLAGTYDAVVTIEEHSVIGGLGSAVAETIAENALPLKLHTIGIKEKPYIMGKRPFMLKQAGLDVEGIVNKLESII